MKKLFALFTLIAATTATFSQMHMPVAQPKFVLICNPKVQKHLKMTVDQVKKVKSLMEGIVEDDGHGRQMIRLSGDTDLEQLDKDTIGVLDKEQSKRFGELYAQRNGYTALSVKEYAEELGLSKEQTEKLEQVWDHHRERLEAYFTENSPGSRELKLELADREKLEAATSKEVEAVLTSEQIAKWKTMLGEKFEFGDKS